MYTIHKDSALRPRIIKAWVYACQHCRCSVVWIPSKTFVAIWYDNLQQRAHGIGSSFRAIYQDLAVSQNGIGNQNLMSNWGLVSWWRHLKFKFCRCQKLVPPPKTFKISWRVGYSKPTYLHSAGQGAELVIAWATADDVGLCGSLCSVLRPCGELLTTLGKSFPEAKVSILRDQFRIREIQA